MTNFLETVSNYKLGIMLKLQRSWQMTHIKFDKYWRFMGDIKIKTSEIEMEWLFSSGIADGLLLLFRSLIDDRMSNSGCMCKCVCLCVNELELEQCIMPIE